MATKTLQQQAIVAAPGAQGLVGKTRGIFAAVLRAVRGSLGAVGDMETDARRRSLKSQKDGVFTNEHQNSAMDRGYMSW